MISTKIVRVDPLIPQPEYLKEAADILRKGGLIIMPTETVYGIAANMLNKKAIDRLYAIKQRPKDKHFSLHIDTKDKLEDFACDIPICGYKLIDKFWPGPLTLILKSKNKDSIGIRVPDDEVARRLLLIANVPVVCPSANISGFPSPVSFEQAIKDLNGLVDFAIDAGITRIGVESSVVDLTSGTEQMLREGAIKKAEIEEAANKKSVLFVCTGNSCRSVMAKGLLEKKLSEKNRKDIEVLSRGIMMLGGLGPTEETKELLKREGIDVSGHYSQRIDKYTIKMADIILVMEKLHEEKILQLAPEVKNRLFLLKEFAKINANNSDLGVADPIGKSFGFYEQTFAVIKEAIERIAAII